MSFLADSLSRVKPSATIAVTQKARELKEAGRDVIGLGAGEPDFDTPDNIKEAAIAAIRRGETKYPPVAGIGPLRKAIAEKFKRENGLDYKPEQVIVGTGGKQILYNAFVATLNPGDEVLIPAPYWVSYPEMVALNGGEARFVECPIETGFKLTPEALDSAITPRTKWLIFNAPSNPSGAAYTADGAEGADRCADEAPAGVDPDRRHVRAPALHRRAVRDDRRGRAAALRAHAHHERRVEDLCDDRLAHRLRRRAEAARRRDGDDPGPADVGRLHHRAMGGGGGADRPAGFHPEVREGVPGAARPRRLDAEPGARAEVPVAGGRVLRLSVLRRHDRQEGAVGQRRSRPTRTFCRELLEAEGVAVVHGSAFGLGPNFRISYATSSEILEEACTRIQRFCNNLN